MDKKRILEDETINTWNKKAKEELDPIKKELDNLKNKRNVFEEDLRSLQQDLKSFQNYHQELQQDLKSFQNYHQELQQDLKSLQQQLLESQVAGHEIKTRILEKAVAEKKEEIAEKKEEIAKKEEEIAKKKEEIAEKKEEIAKKEVEIADNEARIASTPEAKERWKQQADAARREVNLLSQARIKALEVQIAETVVLRNDPPELEDLEKIRLPSLELVVVSDSVFPPLGPDGAPDLRFLKAHRPPAEKLADKLRSLPFGSIHREIWIAVSGSGKTSAIFQVGREFYTIYIPCIPKSLVDANTSTRIEREKSGTFVILENAILLETAKHFRHHSNREKTDNAKRLSAVFIVSHFFILLLFLTKFPTATPIEYLYFQLSKTIGQRCVNVIFTNLSTLTQQACEFLAESIRTKLRDRLKQMGRSPNILLAIDEIEGAATQNEAFLYRTNKLNRGILSPFLQAVGDLEGPSAYSMIICGTGSSYERVHTVTSDIGKGELYIMPDFYMASEQAVVSMLKKLPGVDDECIRNCFPNISYLVDSRFRLLTRTVEDFYKISAYDQDSTVCLKNALQRSIRAHKASLLNHIRESIVDHSNKSVMDAKLSVLHKVYVASQLTNGRMEFLTTEMDLCRLGLGALLDEHVYRVSEKFALEVIVDFFDERPDLATSIQFNQSVMDLKTLLEARGHATSGKGDLFENVVFSNLLRPCFQDKSVTELPFVSNLKVPKLEEAKNQVWSNVKFKCTDIMHEPPNGQTTAHFVAHNLNVILSPEVAHRTDGVTLLDHDHLLMIGAKLYTHTIPANKVASQFRSTHPDKVYQLADIEALNSRFKAARAEWDKHGLNRIKALRIHLNIPKSTLPYENDLNEIYRAGTWFVPQDNSLVVNIDMSNIKDFFYAEFKSETEKQLVESILRLLGHLNN